MSVVLVYFLAFVKWAAWTKTLEQQLVVYVPHTEQKWKGVGKT